MRKAPPDDSLKLFAPQYIRAAQDRQAGKAGIKPPQTNVCVGLVHTPVFNWLANGDDFIYVDHSYFQRGWYRNHFRAIRRGFHLNRVLKRPDDRLKRFGVEIKPWRKSGRRIVIIPPGHYYRRGMPELFSFALDAEHELRKYTDRPIEIKEQKYPALPEVLDDVWAVVTALSAAGVEAALAGVPVFSLPLCASYPVNAGTLADIEKPHYAENRHEWACSLAYACWHKDEIDAVRWLDYDYQGGDHLP